MKLWETAHVIIHVTDHIDKYFNGREGTRCADWLAKQATASFDIYHKCCTPRELLFLQIFSYLYEWNEIIRGKRKLTNTSSRPNTTSEWNIGDYISI